MKSTEKYLDDYLDKYNELKRDNELWRLRLTPEEFIQEIEKIREYGINARKFENFDEKLIKRNEDAAVSVLLMRMRMITSEEARKQAEEISKRRQN